MSRADAVAFEEFFGQRYRPLVLALFRLGASLPDAEDAVQAVFGRLLERWTTIRNPDAYVLRAIQNELIVAAKRKRADLVRATGWASKRCELSAADTYHRDEVDTVQQCLTVLPRRQREALALIYDGYRPNEAAEVLGGTSSTVRTNLLNARRILTPLVIDDDHERRLWLRSGERVYKAFFSDEDPDALPIRPRPVIARAWKKAKEMAAESADADTAHGTGIANLTEDEVVRRRLASPVARCPWGLDAMIRLAAASEHLLVVVDGATVVLWRGGAEKMLDAADELGYREGVHWNLTRAGVNAVSLAAMIGRTVTVNRWEHSCSEQHSLSCVAAPVCDPLDGRVLAVLNLTGTRPIVPHALQRQVDLIARRMQLELRTLQPHGCR